MTRGRPALLDDLPDQVFTAMLAASARAAVEPGPRLIDLGRGNPDLPPPPVALDAVREAMLETATPAVHGYAPFQGHPALREAIAAHYAVEHGVEIDPDTEVAVLPGTKTGIMLAALATAGRHDGVLLPDPGYPDYRSGVALAGAREVTYPLDPSAGHQPDLDAIAAAERGRAALVVLNFPSNPAAVCAAPGTFEAAVAYAHRHGIWLLNDLAYGFLAFDGHHGDSVLAVPGARDVAIELWSPSKIYGMAGWRIGFAVGASELIARIRLLLDHLHAGVFTALQRGLFAALRGDQEHVGRRREVYRLRRDALIVALRAAGAEIEAPQGTFYVWWQPPAGLTPERLIAEARVSVAPGAGFGRRGAGRVRLSLAVPDTDVAEGAQRLALAVARAA